jgi:hypothetical protein
LSKARSKVWFRFRAPSGDRWTVYFSLRQKHPSFFNGKQHVGACWWGGRYKHRIYIDANQSWKDICKTLLHELHHVVYRPLGLSQAIDEAIVNDVSDDLGEILFAILPAWPEYEG